MTRSFYAASLATLSIALASQAHAAAPTAPAPAAAAAPADATTPADADTSSIQDIIVTATKRETNLQKTPIAIAVVNAQAIQDRHVQSLIDLADGGVPSLRVATFEARQSALTIGIRGIVPFDANQTARDQGVGVYVDGVYLGRQQGLNAALFDIQRIEVLRGPQGTLFGRNTEGGALSIVTKEPGGPFGGRIYGSVGNYGSYTGEAHINAPLTEQLAVKVDGLIQHQDATITNPLPGQFGWNYYNRVGGRVSAKWTPVDGFSAVVAFDRAKDENTPFYSQLLNYNPAGLRVATLAQIAANGNRLPAGTIAPLSPLVVVSGSNRMTAADIGVPQQQSIDRTQGASAVLKYKLTPGIELRSITAWREVETDQWDNSGGAHRTVFLPNASFSRYSLSFLKQRQFSQEFQLVGSMPQLDYVLGAYYFNERAQEEAATPSTNKWNADGTAYTINDPQTWARQNLARQRASYAFAKSYSVFGQATFTPGGFDFVHLTAGGRYTHDKRDGLLFVVQNKASNFPFTYSKSRFDPMVTLAVEAAQTINLYAKYATGFRAGGANDRSQTFAPFDAEVVKSYELGAKMELFDRRVRLNLAGYIMDRTGTQIDFDNVDTVPSSPTFNLHTEETRNAPGVSKIHGFEAELTTRVADYLTVGGSYAYTYTRVPPTANPFIPGNPLTNVFVVFTPRNAASGYADFDFPATWLEGARLRMHVDANYADSQYSFQNEAVKVDASFLVNGRVALTDIPLNGTGTKATIGIWARNLLNESHIYRRSNANSLVLGDYVNFNPPRTAGVEATINF